MGIQRKRDVDTRAETDKPVTFSACNALTRLDITQYTPRNQSGNLNNHHILTLIGSYPQSIAFIVGGGLVEGGIDEFPLAIPAFLNFTRHRNAVGMDIEYVHENTQALGTALQIRVVRLTLCDNPSVRRANHAARRIRDLSRWITEELDDKRSENPEGNCPGIAGKKMNQHGDCNG